MFLEFVWSRGGVPRRMTDWAFFYSLGDDTQLFSFFVVVVIDGIIYGKKIHLDICHSYFYDGCC